MTAKGDMSRQYISPCVNLTVTENYNALITEYYQKDLTLWQ